MFSPNDTISPKLNFFLTNKSSSISSHSISSLLPDLHYSDSYAVMNDYYNINNISSGYEPDNESEEETNSLATQSSIYLAHSWPSIPQSKNTTSTDCDSQSTFASEFETTTVETESKSSLSNVCSELSTSASRSEDTSSASSWCTVCKMRKRFNQQGKIH